MTTVSTVRPIPTPGKLQDVRFALSGVGANFIRVWCTAAPPDSALAKQLAAKASSRVQVYEGPGGADAPWRYTFDKGGVYTFTAQEYTQGGRWGGGYEGDPRGAVTETRIGAEFTTLSVCVAQRLTQKLGFGDDTATLLLYMLDDRVVQTYAGVHGEDSPAIIEPTSDAARNASNTLAMTNAIRLLVGASSSTALGDIGVTVNEMIDKFTTHTSGGHPSLLTHYHQNDDDQTDLSLSFDTSAATSLVGIATAINKLRQRFSQHILNSKSNDPTHPEYQLPGGILIHDQGGLRFDTQNALLSITANEAAPDSIYAATADFYRAYTAHINAPMHEVTAGGNVGITTATGILWVHVQFLSALQVIAPTPAPGQSTGASRLISQGGFQEG